MELVEVGIKTARERNRIAERILDAVQLCDSREMLVQCWQEFGGEIEAIKQFDEQREGLTVEVYPIIEEAFKQRNDHIESKSHDYHR